MHVRTWDVGVCPACVEKGLSGIHVMSKTSWGRGLLNPKAKCMCANHTYLDPVKVKV